MKIESEIITMFISICFALLGVFILLFTGDIYFGVWIVSFLALLASYTINLIDRIHFECPEIEELEKVLDKGDI